MINTTSCSIVLPNIGRRAYLNSPSGRLDLKNDCEQADKDLYNRIIEVWGATPTVEDEPNELANLTFEELKEKKKADIASSRYDYEIVGITFKNVHVTTDREDQAMITAIALSATLNNDFTTIWKGSDGYIDLNAQEVLTLAYLVAEHVEAAFAEEKRLSELIDSAQTEEELNAIVWSL